ncbi:hypothetical protein A8B78_01795 [Jannaschia sp. EhC01]|nr:hypothetical protein A8B78_01795 [Jannaschia sp. EhC01]
MTKRLCFAAGDVGGARAILPVARLAAAEGHRVLGLDHGVFRTEGADGWHWVNHEDSLTADFDALIYATSVADPLAFQTALSARARGIPIIHVLDNWSQYAERLHGPNRFGVSQMLIPDVYCVMDQLARLEAIAAGVPEAILQITGHPNLAGLAEEEACFAAAPSRNGHILFVSEPAVIDSGDRDDPNGRGYDEVQVSALFAEAYAALPKAQTLPIHIAPHPREDRIAVTTRWQELAQTHGLRFQIVPTDGVREALHTAKAVVGMSSLLLYEAWLLGQPTLSLQPDLRMDQLAQPGKRDGLELCTQVQDVMAAVQRLAAAAAPKGSGRRDMALHSGAARAVLFCAM